jgi:hypothetical protein
MFKIVSTKAKDICPAYRCNNKKADKKRFCCKHHARYQKETNLASYTYSLLKQNAKMRGKEFTLTLDEFKQLCIETNYLELKGKNKKSASIDRIGHKKGYSFDNIQILTLSANSQKRWQDEKNCPF